MCATVLTGCFPEPLAAVNQSLAFEIEQYENMELVGQLTIKGNVPCLFCGKGDECEMSAIEKNFSPEVKASDIKFSGVEDQKEVWEEAKRIGRVISDRIQ